MPIESKTAEQPTETALTLKHAMLSTVFKKTEATRFLELIDEEVMTEICDETTVDGQKRERSLASGISSFKVHMNDLGLASIEKQMATVKATKAYLKEFCTNCDERRDKRKAPSLRHEADEDARKHEHHMKIKWMREMAVLGHQPPIISALEDLIRTLKEVDETTFEEYSQEANIVKHETLEKLNLQLSNAIAQAEQSAELKRLQDAEEKRKVEDAERLAEDERRKAIGAVLEQKRLDDIAAKEKAEEQKKAAEEADKQREIDANERIEQAKKDAIEHERNRAKRAQEQLELEAMRKADAQKAKDLAERNAELERQADKDHQSRIREEVATRLYSVCGLSGDDAAKVMTAIEAGDIPHVQINF